MSPTYEAATEDPGLRPSYLDSLAMPSMVEGLIYDHEGGLVRVLEIKNEGQAAEGPRHADQVMTVYIIGNTMGIPGPIPIYIHESAFEVCGEAEFLNKLRTHEVEHVRQKIEGISIADFVFTRNTQDLFDRETVFAVSEILALGKEIMGALSQGIKDSAYLRCLREMLEQEKEWLRAVEPTTRYEADLLEAAPRILL